MFRNGLSTGFDPNPLLIEVSRDDAADFDSRAVLAFGPLDAGDPAPINPVLAGASIRVRTAGSASQANAVFEFHPFAGESGVPAIGEGFEEPNLAGSFPVPSSLHNTSVALDPGKIASLLDAGENVSISVRPKNDGTAANLLIGSDASFSPELSLTWLDPATGKQWLGGDGPWESATQWSTPEQLNSVFIMPDVDSTVDARSDDHTRVEYLTIGGGDGEAVFRTGRNHRVITTKQTTILANGTLDLWGTDGPRGYPEPHDTNGLRIAEGGSINWNEAGQINLREGFLSTPAGSDFVIDGSAAAILGLRSGAQYIQDANSRIVVGQEGTGIFSVFSSGPIQINHMVLGERESARGLAFFDGQGSTEARIDFLQIGPAGNGVLNLQEGGAVDAGFVFVGGDPSFNYEPTTFGRLQVNSGGSLSMRGGVLALGNAYVGVGRSNSSLSGTATFNGVNVSLYGDETSDPVFEVGIFGVATLSEQLTLGQDPSGAVDGTGSVVVEAGGVLETPRLVASLGLAGGGTGRTQILVQDADSRLSVHENLLASYYDGHTELSVIDEGRVEVGGVSVLGGVGASTSANLIINGGSWTQTGDLLLGGLYDPDTDTHFDGGVVTVSISGEGGTQDSPGLNAAGAVRLFERASLALDQGATLNARTIHNQRGGRIQFDGGELNVETFFGDLKQDGGTLAIENTTGTTAITDDYLFNGGVLVIDIGGVAPGVDHDLIEVGGAASLFGTLDVRLTDDYIPSLGDQFAFLSAESGYNAYFSDIDLPDLATWGLDWWLRPNGLELVLEVVATSLVGDFDGSGQVEQGDLNLVLNNWGINSLMQEVPPQWISDPPEGRIDQSELNAVLNNWGATASPSFAGFDIPEPAGLAALAGFAFCGTRRRGRAAS